MATIPNGHTLGGGWGAGGAAEPRPRPRRGHAAGGRRLAPAVVAGLVALLLSACSPAMDWRQMRPADWTITLALPCRPSQVDRTLPLAGAPVRMTMLSCSVGDDLFAVSAADVGDPSRVGPALRALGEAARANVDGQVRADLPAQVPGMTPQAAARRWRIDGRRPDGQPVQMQVMVFAHGTRVYQATALGAAAGQALADPLFDGLGVRP